MTDYTGLETEAAVVAELAEEAAAREVINLVDDRLIGVLRSDDQTLDTIDLEQYDPTPARKTGTVTLADADSFVAYVDRHSLQRATTLWSDIDTARIVAVLDDHTSHVDADREGVPGWGQHRATLQLRHTNDWNHWLKLDGKYVDQKTFAEHLEDGVDAIAIPDPATMLEVAQTFQAKSGVNFTSSRQLSGDVEFAFEETTTARAGQRGTLEVPQVFTLALVPFDGGEAFAVRARFRYRLNDGNLSLGYRLIRPDKAKQAAFDDIVGSVAAAAAFPVMAGRPPLLMNDEQAEAVALAVMTLAVTVRDEGPAAVTRATQDVLAAAGGDPIAALTVAAALVPVDAPPDVWWRDPQPRFTYPVTDFGDPDHPAHGSHAGYNRHRAHHEQPCEACAVGESRYQAARHERRKMKRSAAA